MSTLTATTPTQSSAPTKVGWVITVLVALFFTGDSLSHVLKPEFVEEAFRDLDLPMSMSVPIGVILAACIVLYVVPKTDVLGAVLLTSYLGGAMAIQMSIEAPLGDVLFPVIFGLFVWVGLWLRDPKVREVMPVRRDR